MKINANSSELITFINILLYWCEKNSKIKNKK